MNSTEAYSEGSCLQVYFHYSIKKLLKHFCLQQPPVVAHGFMDWIENAHTVLLLGAVGTGFSHSDTPQVPQLFFRQISHPQMAANFALSQWWTFSEGGKGLSSCVCHRILRALVCWMFKNAQGNLFIQSEPTSATYAKYDSIWKWILNWHILSLTFLKQDWDLTGRSPYSLVDHLYQSDISEYFQNVAAPSLYHCSSFP